jgi:neopullulanase
MIKRALVLVFTLLACSNAMHSQDISLSRVEPPNWWSGFNDRHLQILFYGTNIAQTEASLTSFGTRLPDDWKISNTGNPNYLFMDMNWDKPFPPGMIRINFSVGTRIVATYNYSFKAREQESAERKGFSSSDVIYLLMPDRFANGDTLNDSVPGMLQGVNRLDPDGRHGGDIKGIRNHLDYIKELGATAIWITPLLENNMAKYSYHGYSTTDYYKIDPRFGTNEDYVKLADELHKRGMKLIMDIVYNHCGSNNWWMNDPPTKDWLNEWPEFTRTSYRASTDADMHISTYDSNQFLKGWFDKTMPDLNQHNPFMANYLIQNSIWWIEYAGLDGIRSDTHPYSFKDFSSEWMKRVLTEYPGFNVVGECWVTQPGGIAYWQKDANNKDGYNSNLPSVFDFSMYDALRMGLTETDGWNTGIFRLYDVISQDVFYTNPMNICVLADNHDVDRFLTTQKDDSRNLKMALAFVLTTRGIPEIYYGSEILMTGNKEKGDGAIRKDFPGGWPGDTVNAFVAQGRTAAQEEMYNYLHTLLNWRKGCSAVQTGKLTHFIPNDGVYVFFRYNETATVMVALNNSNTEAKKIDSGRYREFFSKFTGGKEIISGAAVTDLTNITVPAKSALIIELTK